MQTLREALLAASGKDSTAPKGIAVPFSVPGASAGNYVCHVLPLTSGCRTSVSESAATAMFVSRANPDFHSPAETAGRYHKLTPTEVRVLMAIVELGSVPEVAAALGVAETTIKTHLCRIYAKTGARRQVDLVRLLAGLSSPLRM
jgi:DNA-binding CsgD family transcriptional regulator